MLLWDKLAHPANIRFEFNLCEESLIFGLSSIEMVKEPVQFCLIVLCTILIVNCTTVGCDVSYIFLGSFSLFCQFCSDYKSLYESLYASVGKNAEKTIFNKLKFIATKDKLYLFLEHSESRESLYELEYNCRDCPRVGNEQQLSQVFENISNLDDAFIQDGLTYIFHDKVINLILIQINNGYLCLQNTKGRVSVFDNRSKLREMAFKDLWKSNISYATIYRWGKNTRRLIKRFIPPKSGNSKRKDPIGLSIGSYAFDYQYCVEVVGNYGSARILDEGYFYSFSEYLVPYIFHSYLPLPNGDAIFTKTSGSRIAKPAYIRKEGPV
jgi:hypothetical protein